MTEENDAPPVVPSDKSEISGNLEDARACYALVEKIANGLNYELGETIVTQSERWGTILRVDFTMPGMGDHSSVNRFVSWCAPDGSHHTTIAIGQDAAPLRGEISPPRESDS